MKRLKIYWIPPELLSDSELTELSMCICNTASGLALGNINNSTRVWWDNVGSLVRYHDLVEAEKFNRRLDIRKLPSLRGVSKRRRSSEGLTVTKDMVEETCLLLTKRCVMHMQWKRLHKITRFRIAHRLNDVPWGPLSEDGIKYYKLWRKRNGKAWEEEEQATGL